MESETVSSASEVALAELAVLKEEINQRSNAQLLLFVLNLTAAGGVGSFAFAESTESPPVHGIGRAAVWLVLPLLSPIIGMMWLDHHRNIEQIGNYIKNCIWGTVTNTAANSSRQRCSQGYEGYVDEVQQRGSGWFFGAFSISLISSFFIIPLLALVFGSPFGRGEFSPRQWWSTSDSQHLLLIVPWSLGVAFTLFWCALFWLFALQPYINARKVFSNEHPSDDDGNAGGTGTPRNDGNPPDASRTNRGS